MAYTPIDASKLEVGKPIKKSLLTTIKDNLEDHETRLNSIQISAGVVDVFNDTINNLNGRVGMIVASDMTELEFNEANGTQWTLCDGRSVNGTLYQQITGRSNVPDYRNDFLRGASGTIPLNTNQADSTAANGLRVTSNFLQGNIENTGGTSFGVGIPSDIDLKAGNFGLLDTSSTTGNITGDSETRPRNSAVNWFIKTDRDPVFAVLIYKATASMSITNIESTILINVGSQPTTGTYELDVKTGSDLASLTSIFTTKPSYTGNTSGTTGTFAIAAGSEVVNAGDYIVIDLTSLPNWNSNIHVYLTAAPI